MSFYTKNALDAENFKNRLKIADGSKIGKNIKKGKPFIKNPSRYVFYKFDQIFEKKFFFHFSPKLASL